MDNNSFFRRLASGKSSAEEPENKIDLARAGLMPNPETVRADHHDSEEPIGQLTVDIYHTADNIVVESAIAGARPEDIDVSVSPESISIKGMRKRELDGPDAEYLHQECYWGKFTRSIILPEEVDPENAKVVFKNGNE